MYIWTHALCRPSLQDHLHQSTTTSAWFVGGHLRNRGYTVYTTDLGPVVGGVYKWDWHIPTSSYHHWPWSSSGRWGGRSRYRRSHGDSRRRRKRRSLLLWLWTQTDRQTDRFYVYYPVLKPLTMGGVWTFLIFWKNCLFFFSSIFLGRRQYNKYSETSEYGTPLGHPWDTLGTFKVSSIQMSRLLGGTSNSALVSVWEVSFSPRFYCIRIMRYNYTALCGYLD